MLLKHVIQKLQDIVNKNSELENLEVVLTIPNDDIKNIDDISIMLTDGGYIFCNIDEMVKYHGEFDIKNCKMVVIVSPGNRFEIKLNE